MTINEYKTLLGTSSMQSKYFEILSDMEWHCRSCAQITTGSKQVAGGGGIQGLQRGTKARPGAEIISEKRLCNVCSTNGKWDRWTGNFKQANAATSISATLQKRIKSLFQDTDVIEQRKRQAHELVVDHKFPMERWGGVEDIIPSDISEADIKQKFQLLKKDDSGNHNLLKSRACEKCIASGKRGTPLGINFFYDGNENWDSAYPISGKAAEKGCFGCGWYDFEEWRKTLNAALQKGLD